LAEAYEASDIALADSHSQTEEDYQNTPSLVAKMFGMLEPGLGSSGTSKL
jgi:hypothetical protein